MSRAAEQAGVDAARAEVLIFELGAHRFAFKTADVVEVVRAVAIQPLPLAPEVVEGVINLRGAIVPVLDVRARFGLAGKPIAASDHFIVVTVGRRAAVRVDRCTAIAIHELVGAADARELPAGVCHVAGFALEPSGVLVVYDLRAFLSDVESASLERALSASSSASHEVPA